MAECGGEEQAVVGVEGGAALPQGLGTGDWGLGMRDTRYAMRDAGYAIRLRSEATSDESRDACGQFARASEALRFVAFACPSKPRRVG